jgi:hypothetical protein
MIKKRIGLVVAVAAVGFWGADAWGQNVTPVAVTPATQVAVDTAATSALDRMAAYLSRLGSFQFHADVTTEEVLLDGQKVQLADQVDVVADRPHRVRVLRASDREQRLFLFDGKTFVLSAPRLKYYAETPAPSTIIELVDMLEDQYGIELPLVDLFRWGTGTSAFEEVTAARVIGPSQVGGVTTVHYAFRQEGLDWQIWIQSGDHPLPRKIVLTTTTDDARPQHTTVYDWNLAPAFNAESFVFTPPADFKKIPFEEVRPINTAAN